MLSHRLFAAAEPLLPKPGARRYRARSVTGCSLADHLWCGGRMWRRRGACAGTVHSSVIMAVTRPSPASASVARQWV